MGIDAVAARYGYRSLSVSRYLHTIRYLRPGQVAARIAFHARKPAPDTRPAPDVRARAGEWTPSPRRNASVDANRRFHLLNVERHVAAAADWNNPAWDKLWLYNLHYFDVLQVTSSDDLGNRLIDQWISENPPCGGVGWEPYPTSLRIVNWIKWSLSRRALTPAAMHSLAVQARHLARRLEKHLLGNHLFANAKALAFVGAFFAGSEAQSWLRTGLAIVDQELAEQILPDGGHFERSPMYHSIALDDVLDLINLSHVYGRDVSATRDPWLAVAARMLEWLRAMCHPDGEIAFFNDAAMAVAPSPQALQEYAARLGVHVTSERAAAVQFLESSGYIAARIGCVSLTFDAAPIGPDYLPAHAHADTLAFELSWDGRRIICNSGTSRYGLGAVRDWERSTAAHNTITVDGDNSSEVWHGFRVARRARPFAVSVEGSETRAVLRAAHDGYSRLPGRPVHQREIMLTGQQVEWTDRVSGRGRHLVTGYIPLHPDWHVRDCGSALELRRDGSADLELSAPDGARLRVDRGTYAPQFGVVVERPVVTWTLEGTLPLENRLRLRAR